MGVTMLGESPCMLIDHILKFLIFFYFLRSHKNFVVIKIFIFQMGTLNINSLMKNCFENDYITNSKIQTSWFSVIEKCIFYKDKSL